MTARVARGVLSPARGSLFPALSVGGICAGWGGTGTDLCPLGGRPALELRQPCVARPGRGRSVSAGGLPGSSRAVGVRTRGASCPIRWHPHRRVPDGARGNCASQSARCSRAATLFRAVAQETLLDLLRPPLIVYGSIWNRGWPCGTLRRWGPGRHCCRAPAACWCDGRAWRGSGTG